MGAESKNFSGLTEYLPVTPDVEPLAPGEIQRLRGNIAVPCHELDFFGSRKQVLLIVDLDGWVDGAYFNIGLERIQVVRGTDVLYSALAMVLLMLCGAPSRDSADADVSDISLARASGLPRPFLVPPTAP